MWRGLLPLAPVEGEGQGVRGYLGLFLLLLALWTHTAHAQADAWPLRESCASMSDSPAPDGLISGAVVSYQRGEGARAFRESVGTTYYLAFEGGTFTASGALSPDGRHYAVPYGTITTFAAFDVRYRVTELWVYTTETVPRLVRRIAWGATFQEGAVPRVLWLDSQRLLYPQGSIDSPRTYWMLDPFAETVTPTESTLGGYAALSPDLTRGIARHEDGYALFDTDGRALVRRLDGLSGFVWHPDSLRFAALEHGADGVRRLVLVDAVSDTREVLLTLEARYALRGLTWSPDGARVLFTLLDPQENENRLIVGDVRGRAFVDTCALLKVLDPRDGLAAVFSPDGARVALLAAGADFPFQVLDIDSNTRYGVSGDSGALMAWGAG